MKHQLLYIGKKDKIFNKPVMEFIFAPGLACTFRQIFPDLSTEMDSSSLLMVCLEFSVFLESFLGILDDAERWTWFLCLRTAFVNADNNINGCKFCDFR